MAEIPRAVLSEHFQDRLKGRRLIAAVFLTFRFDPAFFEQEILPVFLDTPSATRRRSSLFSSRTPCCRCQATSLSITINMASWRARAGPGST